AALQAGMKITEPNLKTLLFELGFLEQSLQQKAITELGFGILDLAKVGFYDLVTPHLLKVDIEPGDEAKPEVPSAWWSESGEPTKAFERQLAEKGIVALPRVVVFSEKKGGGSAPKIEVEDPVSNFKWLLKWGDEIHSDGVASRIMAALGYNVDHPIYFGPNDLMLVLESGKKKKDISSTEALLKLIEKEFSIDLKPFISQSGTVTTEMAANDPALAGLESRTFLRFAGASMEPRVPTEVRLGTWVGKTPEVSNRPEVRASMLAYLWLGVWDVKEENTLFSLALKSDGVQFTPRAAIADMGMSLGVAINRFPRDVKAGLVNDLPWDLVERKDSKIIFNARFNAWPPYFKSARYRDLLWMANKIAKVSEDSLTEILKKSGWPEPVRLLYFQKLADRRRQILKAFSIKDPYNEKPIDRELAFADTSGAWITSGKLIREADLKIFPQGLLHAKGRFRRFGW
ncbi:MAG: hypothetical protein ABL958_09045, partial [Bdellovibrionia bacterium]